MFFRTLRTTAQLFAVGSLVFIAACQSDLGEARLKSIPKDATQEQVMAVLGSGTLVALSASDSLRLVDGFLRHSYMVNGKRFEFIWYREHPGSLNDKISREEETPVVLIDGKFAGYGWSYFEKLTKSEGLPNPSRDAARLDSIAKAQAPH